MTRPSLPANARLAAALRELKQRTELSLAGLAERTAYSKSSWDRYLNGKTLPPRQAVQDLCRLAREPDRRYLALWEIAESEWSGRATKGTRAGTPEPAQPSPSSPSVPPVPVPDSVPLPVPRKTPGAAGSGGHQAAAAAAVILTLLCAVVAAVAVLFPLPGRDADRQSTPSQPGMRALCRGSACEGRNPVHMHCAGRPDTLSSYRTAGGAWMELRFSKECGTFWARMWSTRIGDCLEVTSAGRTQSARVTDEIDAEAYVHTAMLAADPGTVVRACFRPAAGGAEECFDGRAIS